MMNLIKTSLAQSLLFVGMGVAVFASPAVQAQTVATGKSTQSAQLAPDALIRNLSTSVMDAVRADKAIQAGDTRKIEMLVDTQILPYVDFERMTSSAVGRYWNDATPAQKKSLQTEFKALLLYTYAGAVGQIKNQTVDVKPLRASADDTSVVVKTLVRGQGEPIQLDYRMKKSSDGWKIYDVNVLGAWLVQTYQSSFARDIGSVGIDGLIQKLAERNKQLASKKTGA
jgi:phospholipid transport system substrate-binding protein